MMVKLKDICTINPKTPALVDALEVSFVPMPKVGERGEFDPSEIKEYREVKKGFTNFQNGDVLFAKITPCMENGKGAVARALKNGYGFGSTEFHVLRPDCNKVTSEWLYYLTSWSEFRKEAESNMTGSAGQKRVPKTFLENYGVKLPELQKQKEMIEVLESVDKIIARREEQLAKLDQLVKSRFIELFGDGSYPQIPLIQLIVEGAGLSYGIIVPGDNVEDGVPMVRPSDFNNGELCLDNVYRVAPEIEAKYTRTRLIGNEILVQVIGQPGQIMLSDSRCKGMNVTRNLAVVRPNCNRINRIYLKTYMQSQEAQAFMLGETKQSTLKQLPLSRLKELEIPVPPMELQEEFAAFVKQTEKSKLAIQQSLDKLELLKKSLMQEYFG